jgi:hypothetical protein
VRPDELSKLRGKHLKKEIIHILTSISKTGDESELTIHAPGETTMSPATPRVVAISR